MLSMMLSSFDGDIEFKYLQHLIVYYDFCCERIDCFSLLWELVHTFIVELMKTLGRVFLEKGRHLLFVICYLTVILEYLSDSASPILRLRNGYG